MLSHTEGRWFEESDGLGLFSVSIIKTPLLHGKASACIGSVRINGTAGRCQERTGLFAVFRHLKEYFRKKIGGPHHDINIMVQKLIG